MATARQQIARARFTAEAQSGRGTVRVAAWVTFGYSVPVSPVRVADQLEIGREADLRQAAYFRRLLDQQRSVVVVELADGQDKLEQRLRSADLYAISQLKRAVRSKANEKAALDRMIEALDRRFATAWVGVG